MSAQLDVVAASEGRPAWTHREESQPDDRAEQISARLAAATPGPWERYGNLDWEVFSLPPEDSEYVSEEDAIRVTHGSDYETDADLIANAPADLAWLLAERERLTQLLFDLGEDA